MSGEGVEVLSFFEEGEEERLVFFVLDVEETADVGIDQGLRAGHKAELGLVVVDALKLRNAVDPFQSLQREIVFDQKEGAHVLDSRVITLKTMLLS